MKASFGKWRKTVWLLAALAVFLLALVYFGMNQDDYYRASIFPDELATLEQNGEAVLLSDRLLLEKGSYTVTVDYLAEAETTAEVICDLQADAAGNTPIVLASAPLHAFNTQQALTFALPETTRGVRLRLHGEVVPGVSQVVSDHPVWGDTAFVLLAMLLCGGLFVWQARREKGDAFPESLAWAVCLIAGAYAALPVLRDFFVYGHDLAFHLTRIESIKDGLLSGQFPVRIDPTFLNGYGYASSVMYGDALLYIPALLRLCGVSMMVSYQAFVLLMNVCTAYLTYRAVKSLTGKAAIGLIAGAVYTLGVYRLMTIYTRAASGEALAMLFYPLVIVGIVQVLLQGKGMRWLVIGMTGMLQTHLISLQIAAIGCALFTLYSIVAGKTSWKNIRRLLLAAGITLLLNLWFIVPFLSFARLDLDIFHQEKQIYLHAAYLPQLFATFVDPYAGMTTFPGTTAEMPLSVGLLPGMGLVVLLFVAYKKRAEQLPDRQLYHTGLTAAAFAVLALLMASVVFPWTYVYKVPFLSKALFAVQFPWRYLGAASALLSIVLAVSVWLLFGKAEKQTALVLICLLLAMLNAAPFIDRSVQAENQTVVMPDKTADFVAQVHLPGDYFIEGTDVDAYLDRALVPAAVSGEVQLSAYTKDGLRIAFDYTADTDVSLALPLYGYPVYRAALDTGAEIALTDGDNHILTAQLPAGQGHVDVRYAPPWYFTLCDVLSLLSLLGLLAWSLVRRRAKRA